MNDRQDIDARIDASLAAQVRAPKLDRHFDAAVWRHIEVAEKQPARSAAAPARGARAARWLRAGNAAGVMVAAVLLGYYVLQSGGRIALELTTVWAAQEGLPWLTPASWAITACALAFGVRFTPLGRWLRAELF